MIRLAKNSYGEDYTCKFNWDENCFVQCGDEGLVIKGDKNYLTAFFEAFPIEPKTFIRGEGDTIEEAERDAWKQLMNFKSCYHHEFERRDYTNGVGFCKHCGLYKSHAFEPTTMCKICGEPTSYSQDNNGDFYCEEHYELIPDELLQPCQVRERNYKRRMNLKTYEEINSLKDIDLNVKEIMLNSFKNEYMKDISAKGIYSYSESKIRINTLIRKSKYVSYEEYTLNDETYYSLLLCELGKNRKPTGRYIKLFSPITDYLLSAIEYFNNKNNS